MKKLVIIVSAVALIGAVFLSFQKEENVLNPNPQHNAPGAAVVEKTTTFLPVNSVEASGSAKTSWNSEVFTHTVTATLPDIPSTKFYEGWLVQQEPELKFFSTGKLRKTNGEYALSFTSYINYPNHLQVVITEETAANGLDDKPEKHVLEGTLSN